MARTNNTTNTNRFQETYNYALPTNASFLWRFKTSYDADYQAIMGHRGSAGGGWAIRRNPTSDTILFTTFGFTDMDSSASAWPADGSWHAFTVTKNNNDFSFYVDGAAQGTATSGGDSTPSGAEFCLGAYHDAQGGIYYNHMNGALAEVAIFARVLEPSEIAAYARGESPVTYARNLSNYWKLDESSGDPVTAWGIIDLAQSGTMGSETHPTMNYAIRPHVRTFFPNNWQVLQNPR